MVDDVTSKNFFDFIDRYIEESSDPIIEMTAIQTNDFDMPAVEVEFKYLDNTSRTVTVFDGSFAEVEDGFTWPNTPTKTPQHAKTDDAVHIPVMLDEGCDIPGYAHEDDAGIDLRANETVTIKPFERKMVGTGMRTAIPKGYVGLCFPRSGLATKLGISLANCVGVIDTGYRGEWKAALVNMNPDHDVTIEKGERVFQLIVMPFPRIVFDAVTQLSDSDRGESGFGSSGRH